MYSVLANKYDYITPVAARMMIVRIAITTIAIMIIIFLFCQYIFLLIFFDVVLNVLACDKKWLVLSKRLKKSNSNPTYKQQQNVLGAEMFS